jgi:2-polyprenyl-6-hydroxyphenyl methylase/3-demethylubiquinone-9 3-methyltransferase
MTRLATTAVETHDDVRQFFDGLAAGYVEQHGPASRLLHYRVRLLREAAQFRGDETVLEIGCGDGMHLFALAGSFARGIGVDISAAMIDRVRERAAGREAHFRFDVDLVYCVGSLEHMLDQPAVLRAACRVLKPGGRFVGLTPNGSYLWYRRLAPTLGIATQHLATDHFLDRNELAAMLQAAGFTAPRLDAWTFIPRGDMPRWTAHLLTILDGIGRVLGIRNLRGGIRFATRKE